MAGIKRIKKFVKSETGKRITRREARLLKPLYKELEMQNEFLKTIIKK